jgi:superfamily II DNA/RNA helicase
MKILEVEGVHKYDTLVKYDFFFTYMGYEYRPLSNVRHVVEESKGSDKIQVLDTILNQHAKKTPQTLIFCNTVSSVRYNFVRAALVSIFTVCISCFCL